MRGDTHSGQEGGLKNPETLLPKRSISEDGTREIESWEPVTLTPFQKKMWVWHEEARKAIGELAGNDPITLIEMGDMTHGGVLKDDVSEISMSDQYFVSKGTVTPWLKMPQLAQLYIARGSAWHTWFRSGETVLSHALSLEFPKKKVQIADHYLLDVAGVLFDVAHHGTHPGKRAWLRANEFGIYIRSVIMDDIAERKRPPDVVLRAHKHQFVRGWGWYQVGSKYWESRGIITPPMAYITPYAKAVEQSIARIQIGLIALEVVNGAILKVHPFVHDIDLRQANTIP